MEGKGKMHGVLVIKKKEVIHISCENILQLCFFRVLKLVWVSLEFTRSMQWGLSSVYRGGDWAVKVFSETKHGMLRNHSSPFDNHTFRDAQCVVTTGNKVVKRNEEVGVTLRSTQQILLRAPAHRLRQRRRVQSKRPVQGLCREERQITCYMSNRRHKQLLMEHMTSQIPPRLLGRVRWVSV